MEGEPETAQLIADWRGGALDARNTLIARLHPELSTIAAARFTKADAMGRLVAFHQAFLPGLRAVIALCKAGRPLSEFKPLR